MSRILGVDPGEKRTGFALSDLTQTIATPFLVYQQTSRKDLVDKVIHIAQENEVDRIVIGLALDADGKIGYQARRAKRLADGIAHLSAIPIVLWDESHSTEEAILTQNLLQIRKKRKMKSLDAIAAAIILQSYLDSNQIVHNQSLE